MFVAGPWSLVVLVRAAAVAGGGTGGTCAAGAAVLLHAVANDLHVCVGVPLGASC